MNKYFIQKKYINNLILYIIYNYKLLILYMNFYIKNNFFLKILILIIRIYQYSLSRYIGQNCRYIPSCSQYMILSLKRYGILKGIFCGLKRLFTCHPWYNNN